MTRLAVTDACIFIDLCNTDLIAAFFLLPIEVHTSLDVVGELYEHQQARLLPFRQNGQLTVHNISGADRLAIQQKDYPKALSEMDKTVLYLAARLEAMVLSSDGVVRRFAAGQSIECHGMLWILEQLLAVTCLSSPAVAAALDRLCETNSIYRESPRLAAEVQKRRSLWKPEGR